MAIIINYIPIILGFFLLNLVSIWATQPPAYRITTTNFLKDPESIVSYNDMFKMGFFSPLNSSNNRYLGIWYNVNSSDHTLEVIWVANPNNPIKDSSGVLKPIHNDFNFELISETQNITYWSTHGTTEDNPKNTTPVAELQDNGELLIFTEYNETAIDRYLVWNYLYDYKKVVMPETRLFLYKDTFYDLKLRSWKSASDPADGSFFVRIKPVPFPEFVTEYVNGSYNNKRTYWRSGPWNGNHFNGVPKFTTAAGNGLQFLSDENEGTVDFMFSVSNQSKLVHYVLNHDGNFLQKSWDYGKKKWLIAWQSMVSDCEYYGKCGRFGNCNANKSPICSCLNGFKPKNKARWSKGDWSNGCVRKTPLRKCGDKEGIEDGFLRLENRKVPDFGKLVVKAKEDECRIKCLRNCWCFAYAYPKDVGCIQWSNRSLIDIQEFTSGGADLFIRLAHSDLEESGNHKTIIITVVPIVTATVFLLLVLCLWSWKRHKSSNKEARLKEYRINEKDLKDLTLFKFKELEVATNYFSETNQLGRGGFGPVYKGQLEDGQEIAIKRLSSLSGQGLQEFMNEVVLISKLQHRNLVRLLGCCVQGEEKLLVYEFMPNNSLDALLFDSSHQKELNWKKRFDIINGICRGLLYLHRDSRLKIIHRDLKASNILLDDELIPKISDFGLARIVETKQDEASTLRVVGTYGYMPPEYAMEGRFSEKSDVFSLGVLLLEIVSGKKNTSHLLPESMSLLAYTWKLWTEKNILGLVDSSILKSSFEGEMIKCIQLGLLCVQEFPEDRPTMTTLFSMLQHNDVTDLPHPTHPAFTHIHRETSPIDITPSINQCTFTQFSAR